MFVASDSAEVLLRGIAYTRLSNMDGRFSIPQLNEVCQILDIDQDDERLDEQQAMVEIRPHEILTTRRLHKTNTNFKADSNCRFGNDASWLTPGKAAVAKDHAPLTCRWRTRDEYRNAGHRVHQRTFGGALVHFCETDIHGAQFRTSDLVRQKEWLRRDEKSPRARRFGTYTFADAFCGGDGASEAARLQELKVSLSSARFLGNLPS